MSGHDYDEVYKYVTSQVHKGGVGYLKTPLCVIVKKFKRFQIGLAQERAGERRILLASYHTRPKRHPFNMSSFADYPKDCVLSRAQYQKVYVRVRIYRDLLQALDSRYRNYDTDSDDDDEPATVLGPALTCPLRNARSTRTANFFSRSACPRQTFAEDDHTNEDAECNVKSRFQILVRWDSTTTTYDVHGQDTMETLMREVEKRTGVRVREMRLLENAKCISLDDTRTLAALGVGQFSFIQVLMRLRGGSCKNGQPMHDKSAASSNATEGNGWSLDDVDEDEDDDADREKEANDGVVADGQQIFASAENDVEEHDSTTLEGKPEAASESVTGRDPKVVAPALTSAQRMAKYRRGLTDKKAAAAREAHASRMADSRGRMTGHEATAAREAHASRMADSRDRMTGHEATAARKAHASRMADSRGRLTGDEAAAGREVDATRRAVSRKAKGAKGNSSRLSTNLSIPVYVLLETDC